MRPCRLRTVDNVGAFLGASAPGRIECLTGTREGALGAGRANDFCTAHAHGRTPRNVRRRLLADPVGEWHQRPHRLLHRRVLRLGRGYASRSLLGSREGTDDRDAMGARNGRASVARSANLGLAFAVRVCEPEPNRHGLRTGLNASLTGRAHSETSSDAREAWEMHRRVRVRHVQRPGAQHCVA